MPRSFILAPLAKTQADQALPVVQTLHRDMTLDEWRQVASLFLQDGGDGGVMACEMSDGHIRGLFCYRVSAEGMIRVLTVPIFIAVGLFDAAVTSAAQADGIDLLARKLGCSTVVVDERGCVVAATAPKLDAAGLFTRLGYRRVGQAFVKDVAAGFGAEGYPVAGRA
ncbi:hypothetical protein [Azospirillum argentinense]